ncbi:MAG: response regulator [Suipraeoptans sp.]
MYKVFIVEDELLIRQNLRTVVENAGEPFVFCGEASDGEMALSMMQDLMPDILLTDIRMPFLDGLELLKHARAIMPWLKTVIISGHDDFNYAQKAITYGATRYILKPVRNAELASIIREVAKELDDDRSRDEVTVGYDKEELNYVLYQYFVKQLLFHNVDTTDLLEKAKIHNLRIVYPAYKIILFHLDSSKQSEDKLRHQVFKLMGDRNSFLYYVDGPSVLAVIVFDRDMKTISEKTYRFINIVRHELSPYSAIITIVIGNTLSRLREINNSYKTATTMLNSAINTSPGKTIDLNDTAQLTVDITDSDGALDDLLKDKLKFASSLDIKSILDEIWEETGSDKYDSMLYRYNALIGIFKIAVQTVASVQTDIEKRDIAVKLSEGYDFLVAAGTREGFEKLCLELLTKALELKAHSIGSISSSHVISRAEDYIKENYCDPNISLVGVAGHVGLSSAHFSTTFSQTTGRTFISYLTSLRIDKARMLLMNTNMKLSAIAMEIGYSEPNYFSYTFKKNVGVTPKEYRSRN